MWFNSITLTTYLKLAFIHEKTPQVERVNSCIACFIKNVLFMKVYLLQEQHFRKRHFVCCVLKSQNNCLLVKYNI